MLYFLSFFDDIAFSIWQAIRTFIGVIDGALYGYIVDLYNVFMYIARIDILENSEYVQNIYNRVGMFLGIFMLFKLSFVLLQSFIDPSKFNDKKNGFTNVIGRCVIAIVLLGITPYIFKYSRKFQDIIVGTQDSTNNILYRVIVSDDIIYPVSSFGQTLATDLYFSFFNKNPGKDYVAGLSLKDENGEEVLVFKDYEFLKNQCYEGDSESFSKLVPYLSLRDGGDYVFKWDIILSVGVAIAVIWILVNYCIMIAVRVIQLAYLQLISPVPILFYISSPDGSFKKWINQCVSTYVDLFIRLSILYFIITLSGKVLDFYKNLNDNSSQYVIAKVFMLIGLLMFGKRVPELLKELFPGNGKFDFGIKSPKKLFSEIPGLNAASGMALGAAGGVVGGAAHGLVNMKKNWQDNKGQGGKRLGKTLGAGLKGAGSSAFRGLTGGLKGVNNKGGLGGAFKTGMQNFKEPIKGDIDSWKEHKKLFIDDYKNNKEINEGRKMYDRYGEDNLAAAFGNREYAMTYSAKKAAGDAKDKATADLEAARSELNAAYNSGDANAISAANAKYLSKQKAYDSAVKAFERSDEAHKISQSKYEGDKKIEDMLKAYKNSDAYRISKEKKSNPTDEMRESALNLFKNSDTYKSLMEQPDTSSEELVKSFLSSPEYVKYVNDVTGGSVYKDFITSESYRDFEIDNAAKEDLLYSNFDTSSENLSGIIPDELLKARDAFKNSEIYSALKNSNADISKIFDAFKKSDIYKKYVEERTLNAFISSDEFNNFVEKTDSDIYYDASFDSSPSADHNQEAVGTPTVGGSEVLPPVSIDGVNITPNTLVDEDGVPLRNNNYADAANENLSRQQVDMQQLQRIISGLDDITALERLENAGFSKRQASKILNRLRKDK